MSNCSRGSSNRDYLSSYGLLPTITVNRSQDISSKLARQISVGVKMCRAMISGGWYKQTYHSFGRWQYILDYTLLFHLFLNVLYKQMWLTDWSQLFFLFPQIFLFNFLNSQYTLQWKNSCLYNLFFFPFRWTWLNVCFDSKAFSPINSLYLFYCI